LRCGASRESALNPKLNQDQHNVSASGTAANARSAGNGIIGQPLSQQIEHFPLLCAETSATNTLARCSYWSRTLP
jgi:hypothetical protein